MDQKKNKTDFNLQNPSPTEIQLTIRCDSQDQANTYATWLKQTVETIRKSANEEVNVKYDTNFQRLKAA